VNFALRKQRKDAGSVSGHGSTETDAFTSVGWNTSSGFERGLVRVTYAFANSKEKIRSNTLPEQF